jgi:hypothetical protein
MVLREHLHIMVKPYFLTLHEISGRCVAARSRCLRSEVLGGVHSSLEAGPGQPMLASHGLCHLQYGVDGVFELDGKRAPSSLGWRTYKLIDDLGRALESELVDLGRVRLCRLRL